MVEWGASILTMQSVTNSAFSHILRKILWVQVGLVVITAVILSLVKSHEYFLATLYGGAIIIASTSYFGWRLRIATQTDSNNSPAENTVNSVELFKGIFIRFVLVIVLLALGLGWLKLLPAGVLSGFIVAQLAFWFSRSSYGVTRRK
jgi:F0F1-type ATP synthase assembly protein I